MHGLQTDKTHRVQRQEASGDLMLTATEGEHATCERTECDCTRDQRPRTTRDAHGADSRFSACKNDEKRASLSLVLLQVLRASPSD